MSYVKTNWVDQAGQVKYKKTDDGEYWILTPNYEDVAPIGTPVNADNLNHIEDGIETNDINIAQLNEDLATLSSQCVKITGNQTVAGTKTFSSAPNVPNSTANGTALSLANRGTGTGTGFIKFGDGTIIQWGHSTMQSNRNTMVVALPTSFSSTSSYRVVFGDTGSDSTPDSQKLFEYSSTSTFKVRSTGSGGDSFAWIAIGR